MAGLIVIVVSSVSPTSPYRENPFIMKTREDMNANPQTVSIILLSIGGAFSLLSIVFIIISLIFNRRTTENDEEVVNQNNQVDRKGEQMVRQINFVDDIIKESEVKKVNQVNDINHHLKGDINEIGLPIRLPHYGFSYTCYPPVYTQRPHWQRRQDSVRKESHI